MCVSLLVENDPSRLAAALGLQSLSSLESRDMTRVESRGNATVLRLGAGGRIVGESMTFNPYVLRRSSVGGDLWAHALLGESHGVLVLRAFSEWTSTMQLVHGGLINVFEANCAFNRFAADAGRGFSGTDTRDRLILGNFRPTTTGTILVPVLFDMSRRPAAEHEREFAIISCDPPEGIAETGAAHAPVGLTQEAALAWLHAIDTTGEDRDQTDDGGVDIDLDEVLEDQRAETYHFSLFKSA